MKLQRREKMRAKNTAEFLMRIMKILNIVLMSLLMGVVWHFLYSKRLSDPFYQRMEIFILFAFMLIYATIGRAYDSFKVSLVRVRSVVYSQTIALVFVDAIMYFLAWLLQTRCPSVLPMIGIFICQIFVSLIWAIWANKLYYLVNKPMRAVVLYHDNRDYRYLDKLKTMQGRFEVKKWICVPEKVEPFLKELDAIDVVFVRGLPSDEKNTVLKYCIEKNIEVYQYPKIGDIIMSGAEQLQIFHIPVMRVYRFNPPIEYLFVKRTMDILVSLVGIIVSSPVFVVTAILIRGYDGGKALYKQTRLTQNGKEFVIYKFRSMSMDAEKDGVARLAQEGDSRITPIGRIIRSLRIDELPQLINVLKGEMSLVGPRPERPEIAEEYMKEMPEFSLRLQAKAGITGYAQIYGKYNTCPYDKLQMDLIYIANPSIIFDLKLLLATIKILFVSESTEGIEQGQITAGLKYEGEKQDEI